MKLTKILLLIGTLCLTGTVQAFEELPVLGSSCSVNVITDICGNGRVSLDFKGERFTLNHGDVHCWFGPFQIEGELKNPRRDHTGSATTVDLVVSSGDNESLIGQLTYLQNKEPLSSLATLNLKSSGEIGGQGGKTGVYHLGCIDKKRPLSCEEQCLAEGNSYVPVCHDRCGGW